MFVGLAVDIDLLNCCQFGARLFCNLGNMDTSVNFMLNFILFAATMVCVRVCVFAQCESSNTVTSAKCLSNYSVDF